MTQGTADFIEFESRTSLQDAAATWLEIRLRDAIQRRGEAVFMASGGSTPGPIYRQLGQVDLDWANVTIGLADERWVAEDHPASNSAMVRETLLSGGASRARYIPMKTAHEDAFDAINTVNEAYLDANLTDVLLLGMGPDAHTLSWFAGARGYDDAVDPMNMSVVTAIDAIESDVTGPNTMRMTLTQPCVAHARDVLLLITGETKRAVFETASDDSPVGIMRRAAGRALTVFYAD